MAAPPKPVHTLVLDAGAIIKNEPPVSTLLAQSENLVTVPAIISEIRDAATRSRLETTLMPFLTLRSPSPASVKFVTEFARKTGDLIVLSKPDIQIIALTYEIECERNGGDWRLRNTPGQKRVNGAPPSKQTTGSEAAVAAESLPTKLKANDVEIVAQTHKSEQTADVELIAETRKDEKASDVSGQLSDQLERITDPESQAFNSRVEPTGALQGNSLNEAVEHLSIQELLPSAESHASPPRIDSAVNSGTSQEDSDSEGWITPSNLKQRQAQDSGVSTGQAKETKLMQVGVLTTDFAMQNVILKINLNLLSSSMNRVQHIKTFVMRCHACFCVSQDMSKQFCPRCGQPSLTRVSCSTSANGEFKLHLKKNMQWNTRGDRYSVPKPVHGSANGRLKGGGKGGWGNDLILAEDQKEYERAIKTEKRQKDRSLMDEDYLPSILTGDRGRTGGRIRVGAGRNVNARKR